uniref:Uncharacterized protein n=1 Tax=uncultured bacterium BLR5 TaxID=506522 RepID=C0INX4_9BACT|nr:hypothetical protein AKSOIL_0050 [uncultured bacterium BLR5]
MAASIVGDAPVTAVGQEHHLIFPGVRVQGPAVTENYWLTLPPIFVVDLSSVFGFKRAHRTLLFGCAFALLIQLRFKIPLLESAVPFSIRTALLACCSSGACPFNVGV